MAVVQSTPPPTSSARTGLVDWALERLCARLAVPPDPVGPGTAFAPLVLVSPDGRAAPEILGDFLARRRRRIGAGSLVENAAIWDGRDLAAALARDRGSDHPLRLVRLLAQRAVVVIDGASRLGGPVGQHGLLRMLDACAATGTMVCISLPDHPASLSGLCPALASRLSGGLVVRLPTTVRAPATAAGSAGTVTLRRVLRLVARHHGVDVATLVGPQRCRSIAGARSLAMYLARLVTAKSLHAIGNECGGRDHTTVLHATRTVAARVAHDPAFAADVTLLVEMLSAGRWPGRRRRADTGGDPQPADDRRRSGTVAGRRPSHQRRCTTRRRPRNEPAA